MFPFRLRHLALSLTTAGIGAHAVGTLAVTPAPPQALISGLSPGDRAEFPSFDSPTATLISQGLTAKALASRLSSAPDDPDLPRLLARQRSLVEALQVLRRIVERYPDLDRACVHHAFDVGLHLRRITAASRDAQ